MGKNLIVAISGKTGAGKTSLINYLQKSFQDKMASLFWDDFESSSSFPSDYVKWFQEGANYKEFKTPLLTEQLKKFKDKNHQKDKGEILLFDAPLGRLHPETSSFIDVMVHIHLPLDLLLIRRLLRDFSSEEVSKQDILEELHFYKEKSRLLFKDDDLQKGADLILEGTESLKENADRVKKFLIEFLLNNISIKINNRYGFITQDGAYEPAINSGPCGAFAYAFFTEWNKRFKNHPVSFIFVMCRDSDECWHVAIKLPDGRYFDGGKGIFDISFYSDKNYFFEEMTTKTFDLNLLDKRAYGLTRSYPRYCPDFSLDIVNKEIVESLDLIERIEKEF